MSPVWYRASASFFGVCPLCAAVHCKDSHSRALNNISRNWTFQSLEREKSLLVFLLRAVCLMLQCRAAGGSAQVLQQAKHTRPGAKPGAGSQVLLDLHPHFMGWKISLLIFNTCSDLKEVQRCESRLTMNYCSAFLGTQAWSCFSLAGVKSQAKSDVGC